MNASTLARIFGATALPALLAAPALQAQHPAQTPAVSWQSRLSAGISGGALSPTAHSQLFTLLDKALAPGRNMLQPRLISGTVLYATTPNVSLVWRSDVGGHTAQSVSIAQPMTPTTDLSQSTTLRIRLQSTLGAQFTAWRWAAPASSRRGDRLRLTLGAGLGVVSYQLDQRGTFVDAPRRIAYGASYRSSGVGPLTYAASSIDIPVQQQLSISAVIRQQWGSARMSTDYAAFDRLDLGGTTASVGMIFAPSRRTVATMVPRR